MVSVIKSHFGDELLFFCYEFMSELGSRPKSFTELFEFLRYNTTKGIMKSMAIDAIKSRQENG